MRNIIEIKRIPLVALLLSFALWLVNVVEPLPWVVILAPVLFPLSIAVIYVVYITIVSWMES